MTGTLTTTTTRLRRFSSPAARNGAISGIRQCERSSWNCKRPPRWRMSDRPTSAAGRRTITSSAANAARWARRHLRCSCCKSTIGTICRLSRKRSPMEGRRIRKNRRRSPHSSESTMAMLPLLLTSALIAEPVPANQNALAGTLVMPKKPGVNFFEEDMDGKRTPIKTSAPYFEVVRERDLLLRVRANGVEAWVERGDCVTRAEAIDYYSEALKTHAADSWYWCMRGIARRNNGQLKEAIKDYDQAIALDPRTSEHYLN